jgi:pimeloyl-ACP methyl ester carboxylesterase
MTEFARPPSATSIFVSAPDGLRLHVRSYGPRDSAGLPVVCLPGLSRTTADFDDLAAGLAARGRRVIAIDYRGRGLSEYDRDPTHYSFPVELGDVVAAMTALAVTPAVIVGTSRGGLLAILLAAVRPGMIAGVVLNDIGPAIELKGLMRIKASLGKTPQPRDFDDAAGILRRLHQAQFPKLTAEQWVAFARRTWREENGQLVTTYDPNLSVALATVDAEKPLPALWKEFDALAHVRVMVIRGETSDILSRQTVEAMRARRSDLELIEIPDQGHTPLLAEDDVIARIATFIQRCER